MIQGHWNGCKKNFSTPIGQPCVVWRIQLQGFPRKLKSVGRTAAAETDQKQLEQLERLRSEDTPRRPMITHTIDQFILNPKSILLTSSYRIPSQNKVKAEILEKFAKNLNFRILL